MAEPLAVLKKAIVDKWATVSALQDNIDGPWDGERPLDDRGNPASGTLYPYCEIEGEASLARLSCGVEYWDHQITFRVYNTTPAACAVQAAAIKAVYDSDALSLTLSEGSLISHRPAGTVRYEQEDKTVYFVEIPYYFQTAKNRTA